MKTFDEIVDGLIESTKLYLEGLPARHEELVMTHLSNVSLSMPHALMSMKSAEADWVAIRNDPIIADYYLQVLVRFRAAHFSESEEWKALLQRLEFALDIIPPTEHTDVQFSHLSDKESVRIALESFPHLTIKMLVNHIDFTDELLTRAEREEAERIASTTTEH